jgi:4-amino-4-deoxy-L-arabinose transferase-like glycosyltransferase
VSIGNTGTTPPSTEIAGVAAMAVIAASVLRWRWVGYQGHDDSYYAAAALDWAQHFPALGADHWALRYPLVLPTAVLFALLGPSIPALAAVNMVAYAGFLAMNYLAVRHWFGRGAAVAISVIGILLPEFPVQATYANPDLLEMALTTGSFWALMLARERGGAWRPLLLSGVLAGLGFLTRETSLLLVALYGLLFLFRPGMPRSRYLLIALGFLAVVGAETAYFVARTGDPLYRTRLSANHDVVVRSEKLTDAERAGRALDSEGVLASSPYLQPFVALFISQKYGLLFYLAIPAYALLLIRRSITARQRSVVDCAALGALVAFLFVALNGEVLYVVPRYFMVAAALAAVPVAVLAANWFAQGGVTRALAILGGLAFVLSSLLMLDLENTDPMFAEQHIVAFVSSSDVPVHVNPITAGRLEFLLLVRGLRDRITEDPPMAGSLVATEDGVVRTCLAAHPPCQPHEPMAPFVPGPNWKQVARWEPPRRSIAGLLTLIGLEHSVPPDIWKKIAQPGAAAVVYRVAQ